MLAPLDKVFKVQILSASLNKKSEPLLAKIHHPWGEEGINKNRMTTAVEKKLDDKFFYTFHSILL